MDLVEADESSTDDLQLSSADTSSSSSSSASRDRPPAALIDLGEADAADRRRASPTKHSAQNDEFDPMAGETILARLERLKAERAAEPRVRGRENRSEAPASAEQRQLLMELDLKLFGDPEALAEGVVLQDPLEQTFGKVIFSLAHLPLGVGFQSERGSSLVRISDTEVVLNGRRILPVPQPDVHEQAAHERAMAERRAAEEAEARAEREARAQLVAARIDFRASVADTKRSKKLIPGYRVLTEFKRDGSTRTVSKRFDDFAAFHRALQAKLSLAQQTQLPRFPRRQRIVVGATDALEARREALDEYLRALLSSDIVLEIEHELRDFVSHDGDAWCAVHSDDDDSGSGSGADDRVRRRRSSKRRSKRAGAADADADVDDALSASDEEMRAKPAARRVKKSGSAVAKKRLKKTAKRAKKRITWIVGGAAAEKDAGDDGIEEVVVGDDDDAAAAVTNDADRGSANDDDAGDKTPRIGDAAEAKASGEANGDNDDDAALDSASSASSQDGGANDGGAARKVKVSFGGRRKVKKQRKNADTQAHLYVEVRDATGLPAKATPYVALAVVDNELARNVPAVHAASFSETSGAMRVQSVPADQAQNVPVLLRLRDMSSNVAKLEPDGVAFASEWRESFRLNVTEPEEQTLVLSLCSKHMLKDTRLSSVAVPLRATERGWFAAKRRDAADAAGMTRDADASAVASGKRIVFDGIDRWLPMPSASAPNARLRVCLAYRPLMEISAPAKFRHNAHIGFGEDGGFNTRNLPHAWKGFFRSIGIKPKELRDPVTAKMVFDIISKHKEARAKGRELTADEMLVDIDFASGGGERPSGPAPAPPVADLLGDLESLDPFAPLSSGATDGVLEPERLSSAATVDDDAIVDDGTIQEDDAVVTDSVARDVGDLSGVSDKEASREEQESNADDAVDKEIADRAPESDVAPSDAPKVAKTAEEETKTVDEEAKTVEEVDTTAGAQNNDAEAENGATVAQPPPPPPPPAPTKGAKKPASVSTAAALKDGRAGLSAVKPSEARKLKKPANARDEALNSIRQGEVKLKPASERALAPKAESAAPSSLGDVLMLAMSRRRVALKAEKKPPAEKKSVLDDSDDDENEAMDDGARLPDDESSDDSDWDV